MASEYRGPFGRASPQNRYIGQDLEGDQHGQNSNLHPQPQPLSLAQSRDLHGEIYREIEKERIRQQVIMSEILRRRALEAEVRRELMVERELALHNGSIDFHCGSPAPIGMDLPIRLPVEEAERRFLEERMMLSLTQMNNLSNRHQSRLSESKQVQCASDMVRSVRSSEVKPLLEEVKEKKKINLQAKAIENLSGAKRALSGLDASESEHSNSKKRVKIEWSCDLCQVCASSERGLKEHLQGKKHKAMEAAPSGQDASKTHSKGPKKKKAAKSILINAWTVNRRLHLNLWH